MGLLEDAIREHLELKRQQGADPGEIAQKEREALEPVSPDEPATWGLEHDPTVEDFGVEYDAAPIDSSTATAGDTSLEARAADVSAVGEETAELDMREVLGEMDEAERGPYPLSMTTAAPVRAGRITGQSPSSALDWQVAGEVASEPIAGQESLAFE